VKEENKWHGQIVEIEVSESVNFHWTRSNLDDGRRYGREAANRALGRYQPKKK
jgi:hypothetical protein